MGDWGMCWLYADPIEGFRTMVDGRAFCCKCGDGEALL